MPPDFLTKKVVKNTGQVPSYFVEQSHPTIIAPETFEMVQAGFIRTLEAQGEPVAEFDERLWGATVGVDGGMTVVFRDRTGGTHL